MILDTDALSAAADTVLGLPSPGIELENWLQEWISSVTVLDIDEETSQSYAPSSWNLRGREGRSRAMTSGLLRFAVSMFSPL